MNADSVLARTGEYTLAFNMFVYCFNNPVNYIDQTGCWMYSWSAKDDGADWKVVERNIPTGYTMTIVERETSFVLINTLTQEDPDIPPPETGDTSNVMFWVIILIISGSVLIVLGIIGKRNRE